MRRADLRAVLHDQGRGRDRPRAGPGVRHGRAAPRPDRGRTRRPAAGRPSSSALPAGRDRRPAGPPFARPRPAAEPVRLRILVVDDQAAVAETLALLLEDEGHAVTIALSATEAFKALTERSFDLVFSDHLLGEGVTGVELATEIRHRWPSTAVALLTAWSSPLGLPSLDEAGLTAVLEKPYRIEQIRALIERVAAR